MLKFGRNYRMKVKIGKIKDGRQYWEEEFEITYPITVNFEITRAAYSSANSAHFEFFNLSEDTRVKLYRDRYLIDKQIRIEFYAGYGTDTQNLPLCYAGDVWECFSNKTGGNPDVMTEIDCITGYFGRKECFVNQVFAAGTEPLEIIQTLCNAASMQLGNADSKIISSMEPLIEDTPFIGSAIDELKKYLSGHVFIDASSDFDKVWILDETDVLPQEYFLSIDGGDILGTPTRMETYLSVDMLFEPRLTENQAIEVISETAGYFSGIYKIIGFRHIGTISGAVGGKCQTTMLLDLIGREINFVTANKASV